MNGMIHSLFHFILVQVFNWIGKSANSFLLATIMAMKFKGLPLIRIFHGQQKQYLMSRGISMIE